MGTAPLHEKYDVALLDLDGVVYLGGTAIPGAPAALQRARADGMHLAYVTNNASRTPAAVAELLRSMDVPASAADVVTSPQAASRLLADKLPPGAPVLVIGSLALRMAVRERGLRPVSSASDRPLAVVQGYAPGIDYQALAEGSLAVRAGALFVGTNADSTLPGPRGILPGNGSLLTVIAHATGVNPVIAGKPELPLHHESIIRTGARRPLVVGDRLDTDIEAASRAATDSLLVFTGVSRPAAAPVAPPEHRPTYLALTLDALTAGLPGRHRGQSRGHLQRLDGALAAGRRPGPVHHPRRHGCAHRRPARPLCRRVVARGHHGRRGERGAVPDCPVLAGSGVRLDNAA